MWRLGVVAIVCRRWSHEAAAAAAAARMPPPKQAISIGEGVTTNSSCLLPPSPEFGLRVPPSEPFCSPAAGTRHWTVAVSSSHKWNTGECGLSRLANDGLATADDEKRDRVGPCGCTLSDGPLPHM